MNLTAPVSGPFAGRLHGPGSGALMAVGSICCVQLGLALSVPLLSRLGAGGTAALRLSFAGVLLLAVVRPRRRDFSGRDLLACATLGVVTAVMMLSFMNAIARIPLGMATALEFTGPLAVSVVGQSGARRLWAAAAAVGVVLLTRPWHGGINPAGLAFCLVAAVCWASYILLTQRVGDRVSGLNGLAVSIPVAGAVALAIAGPSLAGRLTWPLALGMLGLAALSLAIPFCLEFLALRRLTTAAFGTLMSIEPAVALLAGFLVLGQSPGIIATFGVFFVVAAGIGATRTGARPAADQPSDRMEVGPALEWTSGR